MSLQRLLAKWQRILRLQDWDLTIRYGTAYEIGDDSAGDVRMRLTTSSAEILVLPVAGRSAKVDPFGDADLEVSVVHELLHIKLAPLDAEEKHEVELERIVESLARTLVALDRRGRA